MDITEEKLQEIIDSSVSKAVEKIKPDNSSQHEEIKKYIEEIDDILGSFDEEEQKKISEQEEKEFMDNYAKKSEQDKRAIAQMIESEISKGEKPLASIIADTLEFFESKIKFENRSELDLRDEKFAYDRFLSDFDSSLGVMTPEEKKKVKKEADTIWKSAPSLRSNLEGIKVLAMRQAIPDKNRIREIEETHDDLLTADYRSEEGKRDQPLDDVEKFIAEKWGVSEEEYKKAKEKVGVQDVNE